MKNDIASQRRQTVNVSIDQNIWKHALITNAQMCRNHICKSRSVSRVRTHARTSIAKSKSMRVRVKHTHTHSSLAYTCMTDIHTHTTEKHEIQKTNCYTKNRILQRVSGYASPLKPPSGGARHGRIPAQQLSPFASPPPLKQFILPKCSTPSALVQ